MTALMPLLIEHTSLKQLHKLAQEFTNVTWLLPTYITPGKGSVREATLAHGFK